MTKKLIRATGIVLGCAAIFAAGWFAALRIYVGEQAMGTLIDVVSAIGYLEKGDRDNARRMLQISAEGNLLKVDAYGTPILDWHEPVARAQWIQRYARIRQLHPKIEYPGNEGLQQQIDQLLAEHRAAK
jgi:hypothetical protein